MADRGITYDALMALDERSIAEHFPHGAAVVGKRWKPVDDPQGAAKSLEQLLRDKRSRVERPRLLHRDSTRGYTDQPALQMPNDPGEAVPKEAQERFSEEARTRFDASHAEQLQRANVRSYLGRIRQLAIEEIKAGRDPSRAFEAALAEFRRRDEKAA